MYNSYGYNPYYQPTQRFTGVPQPQMPPVQPIQPVEQMQRPMLNGKQVDSLEVVKATDIGLDGNINYFPLTDGSAIITKQLQMDGTSKIVVYKPLKEEVKEQPKYLVAEDLDSLKEEVKDLKQEIKELKKGKKKEEL